MDERVVPLARFHDHISALAAVAARRAAARHIFFAAEGHAAVAAVPRLHSNFRLIDKHGCSNTLFLRTLVIPSEAGDLGSGRRHKSSPSDAQQNKEPRPEGEAQAA